MSHECNLILHCGSSKVEREQLAEVKTPRRTDTWQPIGHLALLKQVELALSNESYEIKNGSPRTIERRSPVFRACSR